MRCELARWLAAHGAPRRSRFEVNSLSEAMLYFQRLCTQPQLNRPLEPLMNPLRLSYDAQCAK